MRKEKQLLDLLRGIADLMAQEADRNPAFSAALDALLAPLPEQKPRAGKKPAAAPVEELPDIHAEFAARGEAAFRQWLLQLPLPALRAVIAREDLDPARKSARWRTQDKLAALIAEGISARRARGGGFLTGA
jgi:hypothetical protein